jgi:hypothetical protein
MDYTCIHESCTLGITYAPIFKKKKNKNNHFLYIKEYVLFNIRGNYCIHERLVYYSNQYRNKFNRVEFMSN